MAMKILLRTRQNHIPFRNYLLQLAQIKGDTLILAYGYIQEAITAEILIDEIDKGFNFSSDTQKRIILIGGQFDNSHITDDSVCVNNYGQVNPRAKCWRCHFDKFHQYCDDFFKGLKTKKPLSHNVVVEKIYAHNQLPALNTLNKWHAKIAVKLDNNSQPKVLASMIGSSNLTLPPFSLSHSAPNVECDIYSWNGNKLKSLNTTKKPNIDPQNQTLEDFIDILEDFNINPKDIGINDYHNVLYNYIKAVLHGSKISL